MKYYIIVLFAFSCYNLSAQEKVDSLPNSSIGISIKPNIFKVVNPRAPLLELEYRFNLQRKNRYRFSLLIGPQSGEIGASLGWERLLYKSSKIEIYGGAELNYTNYGVIIGAFENKGLSGEHIRNNSVKLNIYAGLEYKFSSKHSFFLEPNLINLGHYDSRGGGFNHNKNRFLNSSKFGARIKF